MARGSSRTSRLTGTAAGRRPNQKKTSPFYLLRSFALGPLRILRANSANTDQKRIGEFSREFISLSVSDGAGGARAHERPRRKQRHKPPKRHEFGHGSSVLEATVSSAREYKAKVMRTVKGLGNTFFADTFKSWRVQSNQSGINNAKGVIKGAH